MEVYPKGGTAGTGGGSAGEAGARLVEGTFFVREVRVTAYEAAGESVLSVVGPPVVAERVRGEGGDPEGNRQRAGRRAAAKVRRYCKANGLDRMGTLTYEEGTEDFDQVVRDVGAFFRRLRAAVGVDFAYLWVPEEHESGRLHLHFLVGRLIPTRCGRCDDGSGKGLRARAGEACLTCVWGRGFVDMRKIRPRGREVGGKAGARLAAGYVAKYLSKAYEEGTKFGRHRYEVAKGFQPEAVRLLLGVSLANAAMSLMEVYGPGFVWRSSDVEDWRGPPVWMVFHDG